MIILDTVNVINLVPKFLSFYKTAIQQDLDEEKRWELWKDTYNFAAVPPTDEGREVARNLLDNAWNKYESFISIFEKWIPESQKVKAFLGEVKNLLGYDYKIEFTVIYFVGGFEDNPFVAPIGENKVALCLPIETEQSDIYLVHELTHVVHQKTANMKNDWERNIASIILQEGLATHVSKQLIPGHKEKEYIEISHGWLKSCYKNKEEIIKNIIPYLEDSEPESVMKFTMGNGSTNHHREAYFVGWLLVKLLLQQGMSFEEIAHIQEDEIPQYISQNYKDLL